MALQVIPRGVDPQTPQAKALFNKHVCPPTFGGDNPDPVSPTVIIKRNLLATLDLVLPDGTTKVPMWVIEDPDDQQNGRTYPSKRIRVVEGDIVHAPVDHAGGPHTIHWHGIEPTPMNDGVGKHSFELGSFIYQWAARDPGTYFYHCHKNTTLHFEMGLYGLLLVDPKPPAGSALQPPYPDGGPGFVAYRDGVRRYDVEAFWVADEIDTRWHQLNHEAFLPKCVPDDPINPANFTQDGFLNDFQPDVFVVTGVPRVDDATPITDPRVAVQAKVGDTILLRLLDAGYTVQKFVIDELDAEVIAFDGRAMGRPPENQYSSPFFLPAGQPITLTSARRADLLLTPQVAKRYTARVDYYDWVSGKLLGTAGTVIDVSPGVAGTATTTPPSTPTQTAPPTPTETAPLSVSPTATAVPSPCAGDCNSDGQVTINEILNLVNIAFGNAPPSDCPQGVPSGVAVDVTLILQAVIKALSGCGG